MAIRLMLADDHRMLREGPLPLARRRPHRRARAGDPLHFSQSPSPRLSRVRFPRRLSGSGQSPGCPPFRRRAWGRGGDLVFGVSPHAVGDLAEKRDGVETARLASKQVSCGSRSDWHRRLARKLAAPIPLGLALGGMIAFVSAMGAFHMALASPTFRAGASRSTYERVSILRVSSD